MLETRLCVGEWPRGMEITDHRRKKVIFKEQNSIKINNTPTTTSISINSHNVSSELANLFI